MLPHSEHLSTELFQKTHPLLRVEIFKFYVELYAINKIRLQESEFSNECSTQSGETPELVKGTHVLQTARPSMTPRRMSTPQSAHFLLFALFFMFCLTCFPGRLLGAPPPPRPFPLPPGAPPAAPRPFPPALETNFFPARPFPLTQDVSDVLSAVFRF